jgi:hypothetical protein
VRACVRGPSVGVPTGRLSSSPAEPAGTPKVSELGFDTDDVELSPEVDGAWPSPDSADKKRSAVQHRRQAGQVRSHHMCLQQSSTSRSPGAHVALAQPVLSAARATYLTSAPVSAETLLLPAAASSTGW